MALNFADVASKPVDSVEKPPLLPVGTYRWRITKLPSSRDTPDGAWEVLEIPCQAVEAMDDVEIEDIKGELKGYFNRVSFMFNKNDEAEFEKTLYNATQFFEKKVKCVEPGDSIGQAVNNSVNQEFLGTIGWKPDKNDPEVMHANIVRTAPID